MNIKGFQKISLIDFAPHSASIVFVPGCNFRCGYCHNPDLVLHSSGLPDISEEEIFSYLKEKKKWIDACVISGGEPCLQGDLISFISKLKELGLLVKIDTNGSLPNVLQELIDKKLVDYIAMDIKSSPENYDRVAGVKVDLEMIKKSIEIIMKSGIEYEFRTTVIPGIVGNKMIEEIGMWLNGAKRFCLQQFRSNTALIDKDMQGIKAYSKQELDALAEIARKYFKEVVVR